MPAPLEPGDLTVVVAPSSPFARDELWRGMAWLRTRYRVEMSGTAFARNGFLAGTDERRRAEFACAMLESQAKAIIAARGGYGALRFAASLPWTEFARHPKWIVGFSDITALHAMAWQTGVASVHGPNVTGLGRSAPASVRASWLASLERPDAVRVWRRMRCVHSGSAVVGSVVGGNLSVLHALAAAGQLRIPWGSVLMLEDAGEAPYRVDRMLTSLILGGHLRGAAAIVFGSLDQRTAPHGGPSSDDVLAERTASLGVPVLSGAPFGHGEVNEAFVLGASAAVIGNELHLNGD
ncbi:MAG: LD-carboxypeptidase [Polyangiaceae bacterium]